MAPLRSQPESSPTMPLPAAPNGNPRPLRGARWRSFPLVTLALALLLTCVSANAHAADVNQAKANLLYNIAKFVEWPGFKPHTDMEVPLVFTILGEDELAVALAGVLSSRTVNGHPVFVRFARRPQDAKGSQILYVAASEFARLGDVLAVVDTAAVLTVSDAPGFAAQGGMVGFTAEGERVRFEVNLNQAEKTGLKLSAKLLALAKLVESGTR
jgi:hypothetical protein